MDGRTARTLPQMVADYERVVIIKAIQMCGGSRTLAARSLGVKRRYLYGRTVILKIDLGQLPVRLGRPPKESRQ
jgi:DNA-binding NtrC family response regulator